LTNAGSVFGAVVSDGGGVTAAFLGGAVEGAAGVGTLGDWLETARCPRIPSI
jgi:hypothetical protein